MDGQGPLESPARSDRWSRLGHAHSEALRKIAAKATAPPGELAASVNISYLSARIRALLPVQTIFVTEAVTNHVRMTEQLQPSIPGTWFTKGAGGLGWGCSAALGIKLAAGKDACVCCITGDGSFIFSVPTAVYWISAHYCLPTLTIILNNRGWAAPRHSAKLVNPISCTSKRRCTWDADKWLARIGVLLLISASSRPTAQSIGGMKTLMQCWLSWAQDSSIQPTRIIFSFAQFQLRIGVTTFFCSGQSIDRLMPQKWQLVVFDLHMLSLSHAITAYDFPIKPVSTFSS